MSLFDRLQNSKNEKIEAIKAEGKAFLENNATQEGVVSLPSGLQYKILQEGTGEQKPNLQNRVTCHYHGMLINGDVFDSSVQRNQPATFPLNAVIKGWQEGVQLMPIGSKFAFYIPSALAYGDEQAGAKILPGSTLIFEVELLGIQ
jgi:FKBP-type peptidyl-prolyl cis-trans isomerase FklB